MKNSQHLAQKRRSTRRRGPRRQDAASHSRHERRPARQGTRCRSDSRLRRLTSFANTAVQSARAAVEPTPLFVRRDRRRYRRRRTRDVYVRGQAEWRIADCVRKRRPHRPRRSAQRSTTPAGMDVGPMFRHEQPRPATASSISSMSRHLGRRRCQQIVMLTRLRRALGLDGIRL